MPIAEPWQSSMQSSYCALTCSTEGHYIEMQCTYMNGTLTTRSVKKNKQKKLYLYRSAQRPLSNEAFPSA
jgi:hypothetical protein